MTQTKRVNPAVDELLGTKEFRKSCQQANIKPSRRQANKWLKKRGVAYVTYRNLLKKLVRTK